ncbi:MAG TPA: dienelactone hydrolase family protein [Gemmatimonadales bacterium]|nr:dienelactone hydrolase family protein [Gemmatimonadales bacterium]
MAKLGILKAVLSLLAVPAGAAAAQALPPGEDSAVARLDASPRHGEWVTYDAGGGDSVRAWIVYPERSDKAPVVVVIHEIFGLTDWIRSVTDRLAAEGFMAIAPDLLTGKGPNGGGTASVDRQGAIALIQGLKPDEVQRRLRAAAEYAMAQPAALKVAGSVGFCWGGSTSFAFATSWPDLRAAAVYYGTPPAEDAMARIRAPVSGFYGGDDARVTSTVEPARTSMQRLGKRYEPHVYEGAGHGFLRDQAGRNGANLKAAQQAWPATVAFLRETLGH